MTEPKQARTDGRRATGIRGENYAAQLLTEAGYSILHRNWRCRSGEIDMVAMQDGSLVFVEVRTRTEGGRFGMAVESVDWRKQRQVRSVADVYLRTFGYQGLKVRFDVIALTSSRQSNEITEAKHIRAAF